MVRADEHRPGFWRKRAASLSVLEPGAFPTEVWATTALLQSRPEPRNLGRTGDHFRQSRLDLVRCHTAAQRLLRASPRQAGGTARRLALVRVQHRGVRLARADGMDARSGKRLR